MVAQQFLELLVKVQILARQPFCFAQDAFALELRRKRRSRMSLRSSTMGNVSESEVGQKRLWSILFIY